MKKILILFSHPKYEKSRANSILVDQIKDKEGVTFIDLYERYPDFHIDVPKEKELLKEHDVIIWHHPFYWFSCPPLMKQWIDMVLEFGWAYGPNADALQDKICLNVITTGGSKEIYCSKGTNGFTVNQFLRPFEQTANSCGMSYLPPFAVMGTHHLSKEALADYANQYSKLIELLQQDFTIENCAERFFLNDIPELKTS
ncbi:NAD(P)H-dependent oxidoreductase [Polaribacter sp. Z014]|uniref:NAD(P)H-dependent oxidoreductase n=1 Tax=unclassified Polaribacter TaxID=196858 RepID=UPI00193BD040|nr:MULTISPECIES: NAD(P)H-dependent oxidoreductase [unclassified Polaribacter]MCL7764630.1 NAD(P)H-dependent oxidoreductase [Polaribacter sp. Z014]QVY66404.1 NAD(P)H-dependent oxidoreductase [Polaribacter sp. Q13]